MSAPFFSPTYSRSPSRSPSPHSPVYLESVMGERFPTPHLRRAEFWRTLDEAWDNVEEALWSDDTRSDQAIEADIQDLRKGRAQLAQIFSCQRSRERDAEEIALRTAAARVVVRFLPLFKLELERTFESLTEPQLRAWEGHSEVMFKALDTAQHFDAMKCVDEADFAAKRAFVVAGGTKYFLVAEFAPEYVAGAERCEWFRGVAAREAERRRLKKGEGRGGWI